jgi:pyridoxal phosphate enzyme (YggS family)
MSDLHSRLAENLAAVRERISSACRVAGRSAEDVRLTAVTKYAEWEWVCALADLGQTVLGESRPQQLVQRAGLFREAGRDDIEWHLIGHLQRNKVRPVLPVAALIHSVDSLRLLERIDQIAGELGMSARVLLEVNVTGEASKDGFVPSQLMADWEAAQQLSHVQIDGLMTMAEEGAGADRVRETFRHVRELRDDLRSRGGRFELRELSMGMSGDFELAVQEGATLVRLGSILFEGLPTSRS